MIPNNIFTYWSGDKPPYIDYCLKTMQKRFGKKLVIITPETEDEYIKGVEINPRFKDITWIAQRIDCLRIAVLSKHSGLWADADTVAIKSPDHLFNRNSDVVVTKWQRTNRILNGYFMAQKNSKFMQLCLEYINNILTNNFKRSYPEEGGVLFGEVMFNKIAKEYPQLVEYVGLDTWLPIEFPFNKDVWFQRYKIEKFVKKHTVCIGLNHSQYPETLRQKSVAQHMEKQDLFGDIFRYSEKLGAILDWKSPLLCPHCGKEIEL